MERNENFENSQYANYTDEMIHEQMQNYHREESYQSQEFYPRQEQAVLMPNAVTRKVATMVTVSAVIWLVIAIYQIFVGLLLLVFGVGIAALGCGAWNIYACINNFKHANQVRNCSNSVRGRAIVNSYDTGLTSTIIFLFVNLFLGGGLGVIGAIYDLILRSYVLKNKAYFGA